MKKYPLLQSQLGIILECLKYPESTQYNIPTITKLGKQIDKNKLVKSFETLINCHSIMNNRYETTENGEIVQWPDMNMPKNIKLWNCSEEEFQNYIKNDFVRVFDLFNGKPLYRIEIVETEKDVYMLIDIHHSIADGFTLALLGNRELNAYSKNKPQIIDTKLYEIAEEENLLQQTEKYQLARNYFVNKFKNVEFATLSDSNEPKTGKMLQISSFIEQKLVDDFCNKNEIRIDLLFQAAFALVIGSLSRKSNIAYGSAYHGRAGLAKMRAFGMFVNVVPVMTDVSGELTVKELIQNIEKETNLAYQNANYPAGHLFNDIGDFPHISFNFRANKSIQVSFKFEDTEYLGKELKRNLIHNDLCVIIRLTNNEYEICLESSEEKNDKKTLEKLAEAFKDVVLNYMKNINEQLKNIPVISEKEEEKLIKLSEGEKFEYDQRETLIYLLRTRARKTPDAAAVVYENHSLTYKELDELTDALAAKLVQDYHLEKESAVGVMIERSENIAIYPYAIMKAGCAYMPLDITFPAERIIYMCEDADVRLILTEKKYAEQKLRDFKGSILTQEDISGLNVGADYRNKLPEVKSEDRFIILYTSGTTGKPKGTALEHKNVINFCYWYVETVCLTEKDRVAAYSNFGFDAHMMDIYPSIKVGAAVYVIPEETRKDILGVNEFLEKHKITVNFFTTQIGCLLKNMNHSLRLIITGGELLPPSENNDSDFRFINGYGPTETTLCVTTYEIKGKTNGKIIGRPNYNNDIYIIDEEKRLVPEGMTGEMFISGAGLGRGYLNQPELNEKKFTEIKVKGKCIKGYRTGDLARWTDDGNIEFIGRIDTQVKLRGLRIELGEIEGVALCYEGIKQVCVLVINEQLVMYYTSENEIDETALSNFMAQKLTDFMIPSIFMRLEELPLNANGKVDKRKLPKPEVNTIILNEAPENEVEAKVLEYAKELLPGIEFGVTDDLIRLGFTSLMMMKLILKIRNEIDLKLNIADIMHYKTIRRVLMNNDHVLWFYNDYDNKKPLLVVSQGIVGINEIAHLYDVWSKLFNLIIINPVTSDYIGKENEFFNELIEFYYLKLEEKLDPDVNVCGFVGFSFGGEISYSLAELWDERHGNKPFVIMGDTYLNDTQNLSDKEILVVTQEMVKKYYLEIRNQDIKDEYLDFVSDAYNRVFKITSRKTMKPYNGRVILLDALKYSSATEHNRKIKIAKKYIPNLEIIPFEDKNHFGLYLDKDLTFFYGELLRKQIQNIQ